MYKTVEFFHEQFSFDVLSKNAFMNVILHIFLLEEGVTSMNRIFDLFCASLCEYFIFQKVFEGKMFKNKPTTLLIFYKLMTNH